MKKEILIVDDDPVYRLIVSKMINNRDDSIKICECEDGEIALTELKNSDRAKEHVVVLLDINMPVMDGWSFLEEVQNSEIYNLDQMDIYMVSSSVDESDKTKAKKYNFLKGFYHKPLSSENIKLFTGGE